MSIPYILESAFCLACFYGFYWLFLQRETFFQWNRVYLLLSPVLALGLPALRIRVQAPDESGLLPVGRQAIDLPALVGQVQTAPVAVRHTLMQPVAEGWSVTLGELLWWVYLAGAGLLTLRLIVQIRYLFRMIRRCRKAQSGATAVMVSEHEPLPLASFFGYILWNHESQLAENRKLLLEHELVHVRQWHSLDVLLMEAMLIVQWFNPLMHAFRRSLCAVHEYIADDHVVRSSRQRYAYASLLVQHRKTEQRARPVLVNTFHSLIKSRLVMLAKRPSRPVFRVKYLLALPLFAVLMLLFSFRLVEKLPAAAPFAEAVKKADAFAGMLAEVAILAEKTTSAEPTPYIFYWGAIQCRIMHDGDSWFGSADISPEEFREALKREPRIWSGQSLERHLSFRLGALDVCSDYNDEAVYRAKRADLDVLASGLQKDALLVLETLRLPNGKTATIRLSMGADVPGWVHREKAGSINWGENPDIINPGPEISWGDENGARYDNDRQFYTVGEFWSILDAHPVITLPPGAYAEIDGDTVKGVLPGGKLLLNRVRYMIVEPGSEVNILSKMSDVDYSFAQVRESLETRRSLVRPGRVVLFYWSKAGETSQSWSGSTQMASFTIVGEDDPRLALRRSEQRDYRFEWGDLSATFMSQYARRFDVPGNQDVYADRPLEVVNNSFTANQVVRMLRLTPRLFRNREPIELRNFTLDYNGYGVLIDREGVPEDVIRHIERRLKPGDKVRMTAFQASGGVNLLQAAVVLDIRAEDPKPPLPEVAYILQWGAFTQGLGGAVAPGIEADTLVFPLYGKAELRAMLTSVPQIWRNEKNARQLRFQLRCDDVKTTVTESGIKAGTLSKLEKRIDGGAPLWLSSFEADGVATRPVVMLFQPAADMPAGRALPGTLPSETGFDLTVFPNPARHEATVRFRLPKAGIGRLRIFNAAGQEVYALENNFAEGEGSCRVPVGELGGKGVFVALLEMPDGKARQQFVVE